MKDFFERLLSGQYSPHGYCFLWQPELMWTHVIADALIALAYFSIPLALVHFVRRRGDIELGWILLLFAAFIFACGGTHIMAIWTVWNADYGMEGLLKAFTAVISLATAVALWLLIPKALAIPSPNQLRVANNQLLARIAERDAALKQLEREIAQRELAEASLLHAQKIDAVGQLTGGIAHDFNNLLQIVSGTLELIARTPDDPAKVSRWADRALQATDRGTRLTSQLLTFSRVQKLALSAVDVSSLVRGMIDMLERTLGPAITISTRIGEDATPVLADPTQLELAILNLAINARDAMPAGGALTIDVHERQAIAQPGLEDGRYVDIVLTDTGVGMDADTLAKVFEPFFTTKDVGKGTGLGLSMVYGMAKQSGGGVRIASVPGAGTTATITLKRLAGEKTSGPDDQRAGEAPLAPPTSSSALIMVVDDEDMVRAVITETLVEAGYRVVALDSGSAGLAALALERPDLMIVDYVMPGMNGADVAREAQRLHAGLNILFASGYADTGAIEAAIGDDVVILRKPFMTADLLKMVAYKLGR